MYAPVLVTPPEITPVSLEEAKLHLRVDHNDEDNLITSLIAAAVSHLDGWTGMLGRALVQQTWRQDFDAFSRCMRLPLSPVASITSVTWRDEDGQISTVNEDDYLLRTDEHGTFVRFDTGYSFPTGLYASAPISVTYVAGYPTTEGESTVPAAIKAAILLAVGNWYANREAVNVGNITSKLPLGFEALVSPYRRTII